MPGNKLYTYDDWWQGRICLWYSDSFSKPEEQKDIRKVTWDKFKKEDIVRINETQKKLFDDQVTELFEKLKNSFIKEYENSRLKDELLKDELEQYREFIIGKYAKNETILLDGHRHLIFFDYNRSDIENYIDRHLKKGELLNWDFVHSPNFVYQKKDRIPFQMYVESIWQYLNWLENFKPNLELAEKSKPTDQEKKSPHNPYSKVFNSGEAYELFIELKNYTVNKDSALIDFASIYYLLISSEFNCIRRGITQPIFIEFLNEEFKFEILDSKFKRRKQLQYYKEGAFGTAIANYKEAIKNQIEEAIPGPDETKLAPKREHVGS